MRKSINGFGIAFLTILFVGIFFKRMHLPGAGIMITLGIFLIMTVYLPAFLISLTRQIKPNGSRIDKMMPYLVVPGIVGLTFGILAKIMHWPGARIGLLVGIGLFTFVLLMYLIINRKSNEKISMISVLIVIILLGSFSFNMFRTGNIRSMAEAYDFNGASFSESSRVFSNESEVLMNEKVIADSCALPPAVKLELIKLHSLVHETNLVIGNILGKIKVAEESVINIHSPGEKVDKLNELLRLIMNDEEGLITMDKKVTDYIQLIEAMNELSSNDKQVLTSKLVYQFENQESELRFKYIGVYNPVPEVYENTLILWKCKILETEYQILTSVLKN